MSDLVAQALDLVLYGMGSVFLFLTVLVGATILMSYILNVGLVAEETATKELASKELASVSEGSIDPKILAVISAAVKRYRE